MEYLYPFRLLMHMLWEYRNEQWPVLLTDVLKSALKAAYLSASIQDYVTLTLESLGSTTTFPIERKTSIFENVTNILQVRLITINYIFMCD